MRVAWVVYGSLALRTGGTIYDARIVHGLEARGFAIDVVAIERCAPESALVRRLATSRPDVVVGDELCFPHLAFAFPRIDFARRILLVHHLTCWESELVPSIRSKARRLEAIALRAADGVVTTSAATRDRMVHEGHRRPIDVVRPGGDRLPLRPRAPGAALLFVGAVIPRKRLHELVRALPAGVTLRIAGSRDADPGYVREVEALGGAHRIVLLGEISEDALADELATARALVLPSSLEGYGIVATEAVRAGVPVIAARTPGVVEALAPCRSGIVFFDDDDGLAAALARDLPAPDGAMPTWHDASDAFASVLMRGA